MSFGRGYDPSSSSNQSDESQEIITVSYTAPDGTKSQIPIQVKTGTPVKVDSMLSEVIVEPSIESQSSQSTVRKRARRNRSNSLVTPMEKKTPDEGIVGSLIKELEESNPLAQEDIETPIQTTDHSPVIPRSALLNIPTTKRSRLLTGASPAQEPVFPRWLNESSDEENNHPPRSKKEQSSSSHSSHSTEDTVIEMGVITSDESESDTERDSTGIQSRDDDGTALATRLAQIRKAGLTNNTTADSDEPAKDLYNESLPLSSPDHISIAMDPNTPIPKKLDSLKNVREYLEQKSESVFKKMVVNPFISMGRYVGNNWAYLLIGGLTAIPGAINAFCNPTGIDPKNLVTAVQLMSFEQLMNSLWSMWSNLAPNAVMNCEFFVNLKNDFKKVKAVWQSGMTGKLSIVAAVITGVSAALAAGSIGYSAFLFLPYGEFTALFPALLNATITFISRFNGLLNLIRQVNDMWALHHDHGTHMKQTISDQISHLSQACQSHFNQFLSNKTINEETAKSLFIEIERLKAKKSLFSLITKLRKQHGLPALGSEYFNMDAVLIVLRELIETELRTNNIEELEKIIGLTISVRTLRDIALLNQALLDWRKKRAKDGDAPDWATLADDTLALRSSSGVNIFDENAANFIRLQNDLINHLHEFAAQNQIDLSELVGGRLDIENIDTFVRDINRYPILLDKLMQVLKSDLQLLHHVAMLKTAKTSWMEHHARSSESLSEKNLPEYAAALAEELDGFCEQKDIPIRNIIPSENITTDNLDAILRYIDLLTNENTNLIDGPTLSEKIGIFGRNVWLAGKIGFAGMAAFYIAQVFDFKGFQGLNLLVKHVSTLLQKGFGVQAVNFDDWSATAKMFAGGLPAAATALFYFKHVFDFLDSIMEKYLFRLVKHPTEIPFAAVMLLHTYFSGSSMRNIANNIAKTPDNFVGMQAGDLYTQFIIEFNFHLAATVNTKILAGLTLARAEEEPPRKLAQTTAGVAAFLDEQKTLSPPVVQEISKFSIFAANRDQAARIRDTNIYDYNSGPGML